MFAGSQSSRAVRKWGKYRNDIIYIEKFTLRLLLWKQPWKTKLLLKQDAWVRLTLTQAAWLLTCGCTFFVPKMYCWGDSKRPPPLPSPRHKGPPVSSISRYTLVWSLRAAAVVITLRPHKAEAASLEMGDTEQMKQPEKKWIWQKHLWAESSLQCTEHPLRIHPPGCLEDKTPVCGYLPVLLQQDTQTLLLLK